MEPLNFRLIIEANSNGLWLNCARQPPIARGGRLPIQLCGCAQRNRTFVHWCMCPVLEAKGYMLICLMFTFLKLVSTEIKIPRAQLNRPNKNPKRQT
uniref:Uncharacterized protein n=1 Tax=Timema poppense TaxID=170557 RepID=A0A7R9DS13_TIMPO|nr:unnamed protein product [Timema poppensis]